MHFTSDDILELIKNLNKAQGHDTINIRGIKICFCLQATGINLSIMSRKWEISNGIEKANVVPAVKKGDKQNLKNYCPISYCSISCCWENIWKNIVL